MTRVGPNRWIRSQGNRLAYGSNLWLSVGTKKGEELGGVDQLVDWNGGQCGFTRV